MLDETENPTQALDESAPTRDLLSVDEAARSARALADAQRWTTSASDAGTPLIAMLDDVAARLEDDNRTLTAALLDQHAIPSAADWLLDNHYLAQGQIRTIRADLPEHYGAELPRLTSGPLANFPRVFDACVELISHTDAHLDEEYLLRYLAGYQEISPLTIGEAWAIPIMLRIALLANLQRLSARVVATYQATLDADRWSERLIVTSSKAPGDLRSALDELATALSGASPVFVFRLSRRLQSRDAGGEATAAMLSRTLGEAGLEIEDVGHRLQQDQASDQVSIANTITSLRFLDALDWKRFFEQTSVVEAVLRRDPSGVYQRMDFDSRDRYRKALEILAKRSPSSEVSVAETIVKLASRRAGTIEGHVGHYLLGDGRLELEREIAYAPRGRERLHRGPLRHRGAFYWGSLVVATAPLVALIVAYASTAGAHPLAIVTLALIALIPASEIGITVVNRLAAWLFPPRILPRLDFREPITEAHRTLVVVPALLSSIEVVRSVLDNLEVAYLANRDPNIGFGLLGDLKAADGPRHETDSGIIEAAERGLATLNQRYLVEHGRAPFFLFVRGRLPNPAGDVWMGWERKRGALVELNRALRGSRDVSFTHRLGDERFLESVTFVLTIDADTQLPRDSARKLVSTIAHPLNRARYSAEDPRVMSGYGLIQPRVSMSLPASTRSLFAWIHSGTAGIDPYVGAVSDTYQDVFGEGSFTGKGIYEINVFNAVLERRIPENALLSHDMLEGCFLRVGLASDIEVLDDHPVSYRVHAVRLHRWVRGDWQTIPWLMARVPTEKGHERNPLSRLHRWKILDNLRRSLVPPALLAFMVAGWLLLPGPAWAWPLLTILIVWFPACFSALGALLERGAAAPFGARTTEIGRVFARDSARAGFALCVLPHQAAQMVDAIARALWRMIVSRRNLLEWETAADVERRLGNDLGASVRRLGPAAAFAIAMLGVAAAPHAARLVSAIPFAAAFAAGTVLAWRVSHVRPRQVLAINPETRSELRRIARATWRFFETFVGRDGNYLAPDNFQESPKGEVAYRTSPTNIGLQLIAGLTVHDLGYITVARLVERTADTLGTMAGLKRFRGHFYNWYDTRTLEPLPPHYISTVDSGNLAGHLLVMRAGLLEASEAPFIGPQSARGFADTVQLVLDEIHVLHDRLEPRDAVSELVSLLDEIRRDALLEEAPLNLGGWAALIRRWNAMLDLAAPILARIDDVAGPECAWLDANAHGPAGGKDSPAAVPAGCLSHAMGLLAAHGHDLAYALERYAPWAPLVADPPPGALEGERAAHLAPLTEHTPSLVGLAEGLDEVLEALDELSLPSEDATGSESAVEVWARSIAMGLRDSRSACGELLGRLRLDADIAREMWEHTDFAMLFDRQRLLFSIGYNTVEGRLDSSYYDMLASECRLASFLAIAKGDVPQEHWFRLGRQITGVAGHRALLSWSASMFEYLMPLLIMRTWPMTLLDETYSAVVASQMAYARELGIPWGISESAFNVKDAALTYQYQAFGVPGLGLKRGLSEDIVVAPYASILALPIAPAHVADNLEELDRVGARGRFGYYEAIDFTPGRVPAGERRAIVRAYMAHHQGMSLVALGNALTGERMHERFHADPMVVATELLLQERIPHAVELAEVHTAEVERARRVRELPTPSNRTYPTAETPAPATHFLSNGRYSVMITNGGGGYSRWMDRAVTRYREDVTRDSWGQFFYIRDTESGESWSATRNPTPRKPGRYHVIFSADKAEFHRTDGEIETFTEVAVSPEDDVEIRRVTLSNRGIRRRVLDVTSYFEIALTSQAADQAHRAFSNLFVETEAVSEPRTLLFSRRPRSSEETRVWGFHVLACEVAEECEWSCETNRAHFLGRHRGVDAPMALDPGAALSETVGAVLDPSCSLRQEITLEAGESARLVFVTGVAPDRESALRLADRYRAMRAAQRAIDLSWTASQIELRDLGIGSAEAVTLQRLASRLLLTDPYSTLKVTTPVENGLPLSALWSLGISGDFPILLVRVAELEHAPLVRQALLAHQYWRHKGLVADLVILNTRPSSYSDDLDDRLKLLVRTGHALQLIDKPGGVFLRRADQMHPDVANLLESVARAVLDGDCGSIDLQLDERAVRPAEPPLLVPVREPVPYPAHAFTRPELAYDNEYGGFDLATGEYVIVLAEGVSATPAPWINVMASPRFGSMVSDAGIGCTWAENSHENRISTWNNDPISDGSGEVIYIRDEETGEYWSPTPLPCGGSEPHVIRHGFGYSRFEHHSHDVGHELDWFVPAADPVRIVRLRLTNRSDRSRVLSVTQFVEWVLGSSRSKAQHLVVTRYDAEHEILTAHNHYNPDFPGRSSFLACDRDLMSWTASRTEFVGRNGRPAAPAAMKRSHLGGVSGRFHDNCGAIMTRLELSPGESGDIVFLLGQTPTLDEARELVARYRTPGAVEFSYGVARTEWTRTLGVIEASTPAPELDILINGRLLYQALSCRLWGRTATYQSSGAFGFRDQLQDALCLMYARPELVRAQIIEASRRQFAEGDVLHWWQPVSGRGVRTRITDDRHWMPFITAAYVAATNDVSLLDERTPFIEAPSLDPGREDAYVQPVISEKTASVYEHCVAALETAFATGKHGLPLIGGGDWNDGMNRVGHEGLGESVWMAWFLDVVLRSFAPLCELKGEPERAQRYREFARTLVLAAEEAGWDGGWYRRAYFDDGTPLGTKDAEECRIDAIAQAWAVISGQGDPSRAARALEAVEDKLVNREGGLIALLAPPFDRMEHDPGYIKGYVPGVRENGGQYTHAALWVVLAHLLRGDGDEAFSLIELINPVNHARTREDAERYRVEPYAVAADVYAVAPHVGRGGWSWYTGSASWFYHIVIAHLLGLKLLSEGDRRFFTVDPCIPKSWSGFTLTYHHGGAIYRIRVENPRGVNRGVARIELDGAPVPFDRVELDGRQGEFDVRVVLLGG